MNDFNAIPRRLFALALATNALILGGFALGPGCLSPVRAQTVANTFVLVPASEGASGTTLFASREVAGPHGLSGSWVENHAIHAVGESPSPAPSPSAPSTPTA